ncbi:Uncharacterised protein [Moraxella lacunata]|uniref:KWG Leptospira n=1 Tax=Moraxella lacunata TaxID=477 RepID=A0A378TRY9_MORLA|nr:WG repeat-containing protein [Moraxella lacunata]STZ63568.1 Uncharacterised protein [Moraxella lacunata]
MKMSLIKGLLIFLCMGSFTTTVHAHKCVMPTDTAYDTSECVFDGLIKISQNGKFGAMDNRGIVIMPLMFDEIGVFDEGVAKVRYKDKFGFINHQGLLVVPLKYDDVGFFKNGTALVRRDDEYFMVDGQGQRVLDETPVMPIPDTVDVPAVDLAHELLSGEPVIPEPSY